MRFIRSALHFARRPLATRKRRLAMVLITAGIGWLIPSERANAAATLVAAIVVIIQLASNPDASELSATENKVAEKGGDLSAEKQHSLGGLRADTLGEQPTRREPRMNTEQR